VCRAQASAEANSGASGSGSSNLANPMHQAGSGRAWPGAVEARCRGATSASTSAASARRRRRSARRSSTSGSWWRSSMATTRRSTRRNSPAKQDAVGAVEFVHERSRAHRPGWGRDATGRRDSREQSHVRVLSTHGAPSARGLAMQRADMDSASVRVMSTFPLTESVRKPLPMRSQFKPFANFASGSGKRSPQGAILGGFVFCGLVFEGLRRGRGPVSLRTAATRECSPSPFSAAADRFCAFSLSSGERGTESVQQVLLSAHRLRGRSPARGSSGRTKVSPALHSFTQRAVVVDDATHTVKTAPRD